MGGRRSDSMDPDRRARLFHEAAAEFARHGLRRASLNRIIARAGLSKSSFYHFFANKDDLFRQVLEAELAPLLRVQQGLDPAALSAADYWPALSEMGREMTRIANRSPDLVPVAQMFYRCLETPEERALTEEILSAVTTWLARLIRRGQELGQVRRDLPESLLIDVALGAGMAMDRWMLAHWESLDADGRLALNDRAFGLFRQMLAPPGGAEPGEGGA